MKANRVLIERACSSCGQAIELGTEVWNCQSCGNTMHQACRDQVHGCGNTGCAAHPQRPAPRAAEAAPAVPVAGEQAPCRFCGELILKKARKCRHCGEFQNEIDRNKKTQKDTDDEALGGGEIALCFLCPNIACIMSVVWMIQGKPKGWKMLLLSFLGQAIFAVVMNVVKSGR
jgi:hypothetical protein